jgi:hypothetical protein
MKKAYIILGSICMIILIATGIFGFYFSTYAFLTNGWWAWFTTTYTVTIMTVIALIVFVLKIAAIVDPRIQSNQIIDLIKETVGTTGEFPKIKMPEGPFNK